MNSAGELLRGKPGAGELAPGKSRVETENLPISSNPGVSTADKTRAFFGIRLLIRLNECLNGANGPTWELLENNEVAPLEMLEVNEFKVV